MSVPAEDRKTLFNSIIKAAKNKAFDGWEELAYRLLRSTVHLVQEEKQAQAIYDLFPILGTMYDDKEYPDRYVITQGIIERLEGAEAAERYRMEHLHVPEIRRTVVEEAIAAERYDLAEKLCLEAIAVDIRHWEPSQWAYCLERIYEKIGDTAKLTVIVEQIMMKRVPSYYPKLKALYDAEGTWEQRKESVLNKLSKAYMPHEYAALLAAVGETARLLDVVKENQNLIEPYGKQLAREYPGETYRIYEAYILNESAAVTDRRKYKGVCRVIKSYHAAGGKTEARTMIERLIEMYPRRVAMVDELETLDRRLKK